MNNHTSGVHIDADLAVQVIGSQADTIADLRVQLDELRAENAELCADIADLCDSLDEASETMNTLGDVCDCADDLDEDDAENGTDGEPFMLGKYRDVEGDVWRHVTDGWKVIQKANGAPLALMPTLPWGEIAHYAPFELIEAAL
ncbi:hypothetical protein BH790_gp36 [Gordonia phage Gsput1]|uniref:Uncharacterized protein n=1 Tax=Gordonia phage Gsput1 TaxID=1622193 RepID=A0A0E3T689_9CAUD|nr:hypothetical protein BH790_gp36 [Gordonia phage Gsput1]AKC03061.1 hypothetical protein Gsput1_36 [Gordonia phage Gsput1]